MNLLKKILDKLDGVKYSQEYLCLSLQQFTSQLYVYLLKENKEIRDVTTEHLFIGYMPLIIALPSNEEYADKTVTLVFSKRNYEAGKIIAKKDILATLSLQHARQVKIQNRGINCFIGLKGNHSFLSGGHKYIQNLSYHLFSNKTSNVYLKGNLYEQVQIAYARPRKICLITVGKENLYNLFPTDLHGQVDNDHYIISLRKDGKACQQVEDTKNVLLSDIDISRYMQVYALGKNHMKELRSRADFDFTGQSSPELNLPIPEDCIAYKELKLITTETIGIHKLLLFNVISKKKYRDSGTLSHIHASYATWRCNNKLETEYYLR